MSVRAPSTSVEGAAQSCAPFLKVWLPSFSVFVATGLSTFGLNWWLARSPGGGGLLGVTVAIANSVSLLVVVLLAGVIDQADMLTLLLRIKTVLASSFLVLLPCYLLGPESLETMALAVLTYVTIDSAQHLYHAGLETTLADLAPPTWPSSRTATLLLLQRQVERLLAPAIGGTLLVSGLLWSSPIVSVVAVAAAVGLLVMWSAALPRRHPADPQSGWSDAACRRTAFRVALADAREAGRWIRGQPTLLFLIVVAIATNLTLFPFYSLLPALLAEMRLENQALIYGQAHVAYGVGAMLATPFFALGRMRVPRPAEICGGTVLLVAAVLAGASVTRHPLVIVVSMFVLGVLFIVLVAVAGGIWLDLTPAEVRVRVFGLRRLVSFGSLPIGSGLLGALGAAVGFIPVLHGLIVVAFVTILLAWSFWRLAGVVDPTMAGRTDGRVRRESAPSAGRTGT